MKDQVYVPKMWDFEGETHDVGRFISVDELTAEEIEIAKGYYNKMLSSLPSPIKDHVLHTNNQSLALLIEEYQDKVKNVQALMNKETSKEELRALRNTWILYGEFLTKLNLLVR